MNDQTVLMMTLVLAVLAGSVLCAVAGWRFGIASERFRKKCLAVSALVSLVILAICTALVMQLDQSTAQARQLRWLTAAGFAILVALNFIAGTAIAVMAANISGRQRR
jgi:hypothetical protein